MTADYALAEKYDLESPSGPLLELLFGERAPDLLVAARHGDGMFGSEIMDAAIALGHDGVVLSWPGGPQEYLVFDPGAIVIRSSLQIVFDGEQEGVTGRSTQERVRA